MKTSSFYWIAAVSTLLLLAGCRTDPYCLTCSDGGPDDAATDATNPDSSLLDARVCMNEERCNGLDDDCDQLIDETFNLQEDPANCGACNNVCPQPDFTFVECVTGSCSTPVCAFGQVDLNNDLDSPVTDGCEYACVAATGDDATDGVCDNRDGDCDGSVDEGIDKTMDSLNCGQCGTICQFPNTPEKKNADDGLDCGVIATCYDACAAGTCVIDDCLPNYHNFDGILANGCETYCVADSDPPDPADEVCDGRDNDCDGRVDLVSDGMGGWVPADGSPTDPDHCGTCDTVCNYDHGYRACVGGACQLAGCHLGWFDQDGDPSNGCEYNCTVTGAEVCDGLDNDCDLLVDGADPDLAAPSNFCVQTGVCNGTGATCSGAGGWICDYAANATANGHVYQATETLCDGVDNDCDGTADEYPLLGTACSDGQGLCKTVGTYICNATQDGVVCNAPTPPAAQPEVCDNLDNDCDGQTDETGTADVGSDYVLDDADFATVTITRANATTFLMMQYEASRPDAGTTNAGSATDLACSKGNVRPWTSVTWGEADAACCAMNPGGICTGSGVEWQLCEAADWQRACEGSTGSCNWSYGTADCATANLNDQVCNGKEYDSDSGTAGDQDAVAATGSSTFPMCYADWSTAGQVFDLSGNVKEWTASETSTTGVYYIRGGSYTELEEGRACGYGFVSAASDYAYQNLGFRCCKY